MEEWVVRMETNKSDPPKYRLIECKPLVATLTAAVTIPMITSFWVYIYGQADAIQFALTLLAAVLGIVGGCGALIASIIPASEYSGGKEHKKMCISNLFKVIYAFIPVLLLRLAMPDSKTVAMMVVIPQIVESKVIQQDVPELYNAAVEALKEKLTIEKKAEK